jgi:hypothetical protein
MQVSLDQARRFVLETQGPRTPNPPKSILEVARRIHNIQIVIYTKYIMLRNRALPIQEIEMQKKK